MFEQHNLYYQKLVYTPTEKIYLIGGAKDKQVGTVISDCYEMTEEEGALVPNERKGLNVARASFGCVVNEMYDKIIVAGGLIGGGNVGQECEWYDIGKNTWNNFASLADKRFSLSLCLFNESDLFAFAGIDASKKLTNTIQRISNWSAAGSVWEVL